MLRLKTCATSREWETRASRGEGKVLRVRIYTPPALKKLLLFLEKGGAIAPFAPPWLRPCNVVAFCSSFNLSQACNSIKCNLLFVAKENFSS